jgi:hypothetical protein
MRHFERRQKGGLRIALKHRLATGVVGCFMLCFLGSAYSDIQVRQNVDQNSIPQQDVILITLDGVPVRRLHQLSSVQQLVRDQGLSFGLGAVKMKVSNTSSKSLPGYRALLTGQYEKECEDNDCNLINRETLFDQLPKMGISKKESVVFASWEKILNAVSIQKNSTCGSIAFQLQQTCTSDVQTAQKITQLLKKAQTDRPVLWDDSRRDRYTWDMAMTYLQQERPRLTYLSFVETDEWAHHHDFNQVDQSLLEFDRRFLKLIDLLKQTPGRYENTSIIITTDHGRGRGLFEWTHGKLFPHSQQVFAYILPSATILKNFTIKKQTLKQGWLQYRQSQVKQTVQHLLMPSNTLPLTNVRSLIQMHLIPVEPIIRRK